MTLFWAYVKIALVGIFSIAMLIASVFAAVKRRRRGKLLANLVREPAMPKWLQDHSASKGEIERFLNLIANAFSLTKHLDIFRLSPTTRLIDIYRGLNPVHGMSDSFEFEMLSLDLEKHYKISLTDAWMDEITLGELFDMVCSKGAAPH